MTHTMSVYAGFKRETQVKRRVKYLDCGAGQIDCLECEGSGVWGYADQPVAPEPCVSCKGTGRVLVAVA